MNYWLLKTEPETFGIEHLKKSPKQTTPWEGVRNYQARNFMKEMIEGDLAFFYHSSCKVPGITGIVKIVKAAYPDATAFDPESPYYDPKSTTEKPRWFRVDVQLVEPLKKIIPLVELRERTKLNEMVLLKPGNRLSVTPVTKGQWQEICKMAGIEIQ